MRFFQLGEVAVCRFPAKKAPLRLRLRPVGGHAHCPVLLNFEDHHLGAELQVRSRLRVPVNDLDALPGDEATGLPFAALPAWVRLVLVNRGGEG